MDLEEYVNQKENANKELKMSEPMTRTIDLPQANQIGWIPVKTEDLPSLGLFYPVNTSIAIRAASAGEIRHWSTLNEEDLYILDDMLNYIIQRCVVIKREENGKRIGMSYKDIKEIDRFYLILAIHELTFPNGENKLKLKDKENEIEVTKEMINYVNFDERIMQYYNEEKRNFLFEFKSGKKLELSIPSIGISEWLKNYITNKRRNGENIQEDFASYAAFYILDWKGLNDNTYSKYELASDGWDINQISMLSHFRKTFLDAVDPVITYVNEGGVEQKVPLNFQGGIKSIFIISDPFESLG